MTDLRREFYEAMNKAIVQWDFDDALEKVGKPTQVDYTSHYNKMDRMIIETARSQNAFINEKFEYNNENTVNQMLNLTKKSPKDLERQKKQLEQQRLIELERERERIKYRNLIKSNEKLTFPSTSYSSSSNSGGRRFTDPTDYTSDGYVDTDYVE
jgi:hypothetical protein